MKINCTLIILLPAFLLMSMTLQDDPAQWPVPEEFKNMENPVKADAESIKTGSMIYTKSCAFCHGKTGLGNGPKARGLNTFSGDFSADKYQSQTDGEQFYKTKFGRGEMPGYEDIIEDRDIWHMVNFMRTFKK